MTDVGHDLEFGLFPSRDAARSHQVVEPAHVAAISGHDLVTVQDHPHRARPEEEREQLHPLARHGFQR